MKIAKNYSTLKQEQKTSAVELHELKATIVSAQKKHESVAGLLQCNLVFKKKDYRHKHIAYSLMKGRTYEQIELKCRKGNEPDQKMIERIINEYTPKDVCVSS